MNKLIRIFFATIVLFLAQTGFACDYPKRVSIANGSTATKEDMVQSQRTVKTFVTDMEVYLECVVEEEKSARAAIPDLQPEEEEQREEMLNKKYNAAVEELEKVAAQFNAEVQAYKNKENG
jgi:hypothetical protein